MTNSTQILWATRETDIILEIIELIFFKVDSRGNRFLPAEETPINTPAIATAIVTKDYEAQSCDQISLKVFFFSLNLAIANLRRMFYNCVLQ